MKKTFKKQFILLAVVTVMMILTLVMSASAAERIPCPAKDDLTVAHNDDYVKPLVYEPTCTQKGYTIRNYCEYCDRILSGSAYEYQIVAETGHNYKVTYELSEDGTYYKRVRTCQNELCQRAETFNGVTTTEEKNRKEIDTEKYYLVELKNTFESPEINAADHASYYLDGYYVPGNTDTWVLTGDKYDEKVYSFGGKVNIDGDAVSPDYEYTSEDALYLKEGKELPEYKGKTPIRGKDLVCGRYTFTGWGEEVTSEGTKTYYAQFDEGSLPLFYSFYDGDGSALTSSRAAYYGETISYGELKVPTRKATAQYRYDFIGWKVGATGPRTYNDGEIKLYHSTGIYPDFDEIANVYEISMIDYYNKELLTDNEVICSGSIDGYNSIDESTLEIPRDVQYIYKFDGWVIKEVNGDEATQEVKVYPTRFNLPEKIQVKDKNTGSFKEVTFAHGDKLTLAPDYIKSYYEYTIKVSIKPNRFESEDVYDFGNILTSDILDNFFIQIKDNKGKVMAQGDTDKDGNCTLKIHYSDTVTITANTKSNKKYYGEHTINFKYCTVKDLEAIERDGVAIAPQVTQDWLDGLKKCSCICHSFLSPIIVRIYNILNRIFGIEYVCCDDLFIVHGSVLVYGPKA